MKNLVPILSVTGSDSIGGSGIQADIKTISSLGGYALTAVTAITVQNSKRIISIFNIEKELVLSQVKVAFEEARPKAVKIGMVRDEETVKGLSKEIIRTENIVVDAGFVSSRGENLVPELVIGAFKEYIFPKTKVLILKSQEAEYLLKRKISSLDDMRQAAFKLLEFGPQAVLLQGGHCSEGIVTDILADVKEKDKVHFFTSADTEGWKFHGVAATLSSAVATFLAQGCQLGCAVKKAHEYIRNLVVYSVASNSDNIIQHIHNKSVSSRLVEIYNKLMALVAENCIKARDVKFYSEKLNITPRYLSTVVGKIVNQTPKELIDNYLVKEIEETLLSTSLSLQQVAYKFGFETQVAFSKFFTRQKGISPKDYRNNIKIH